MQRRQITDGSRKRKNCFYISMQWLEYYGGPLDSLTHYPLPVGPHLERLKPQQRIQSFLHIWLTHRLSDSEHTYFVYKYVLRSISTMERKKLWPEKIIFALEINSPKETSFYKKRHILEWVFNFQVDSFFGPVLLVLWPLSYFGHIFGLGRSGQNKSWGTENRERTNNSFLLILNSETSVLLF